jgi:DNA-binding MarR family transcriptional regulator
MPTPIQAEIRQSRPFPTRTSEAFVSVLRTAAVLEHAMSEALKPFGITTTQYNVLRILRGAGAQGLCGREIGERVVAQVPDIPRLLDRLEAMQLIGRRRDPDDRRHVTVTIKPKGLALLEECWPAVDGVERARLGRLSDRSLTGLIEALAVIRERAS